MGCPGSILKTVARHEMRATALRRGKSSSYYVRDCGAKIDFSVVELAAIKTLAPCRGDMHCGGPQALQLLVIQSYGFIRISRAAAAGF